jgi:hypothetical protein
MKKSFTLLLVLSFLTGILMAQDDKPGLSPEELAKKLSNPVASLISVPFQNNTDGGIGQYHGSKNTLNFQPVIPIKLSPDLNLIARVVLPFVTQYNIDTTGSYQCGLSDAVVSAFLSPSEAKNGLTWGVGPVFLVPTATENLLATRKFGLGPTALVLFQSKGWTLGALVNQLWSVAVDKSRPDVNQGFLQPFLAFNWKSGAGLGLNAEITQNWHAQTTIAFINPSISGVTKLGKQTISLSIGPHIQVAAPAGTKAQFGVRASLVFVFPKQ